MFIKDISNFYKFHRMKYTTESFNLQKTLQFPADLGLIAVL